MRSRYLLILCWWVVAVHANAQFNPLTIYANGSGTYSRSKNTELNSNAKSITQNAVGTFSLGIFPMSKLLTGVGFSLIGNKEEGKNIPSPGTATYKDYSNKAISRNVGSFVRYYFVKGFFCEANYIFGRQEVTISETEKSFTPGDWSSSYEGSRVVKIRGFSVGVGYSLFVNKSRNIAIDAGVFYQSYKAASKYAALSAGLGVSSFIFKKDNND